jgi:ABC-type glutathione transport system ATPase component
MKLHLYFINYLTEILSNMETYYSSSTVEAHHNSSKPSVDASFELDRSHVNGQVGVSSLGKSTWKSIYDPSSFKPPKV